ncbi:MAG: two-component system, response regulator PdtaR [Actinomycetota bacterium]|nr:two-component system, response regulator PdtaR [Actinomycetota bacterium]
MTRPIRVMVVDDTDHVRRMLTSMLSLDGFEVVGNAADGPQAIENVEEADPDVVVVDYKMPGMDGLATARGIRAARPDQVMILYTAYIDEKLEKAAADAGISLCIGKVEGLASLEREISRLCASLF